MKIAVGMTSFGTKFGIRFNKATLLSRRGQLDLAARACRFQKKGGEESIFRSFSGTVKFMFIFGVDFFHTVG